MKLPELKIPEQINPGSLESRIKFAKGGNKDWDVIEQATFYDMHMHIFKIGKDRMGYILV